MSAQEFGEWKVMFRVEGLNPAVDRQRHGQLLAATLQGPRARRDGRHWEAADFVTTYPWQAMEQRSRPAVVPTRAQRKAQLDALNQVITGR